MAVADAAGLPCAVLTASASPHEVTLVPDTLEQLFTEQRPEHLIGDGAYDSDPLDEALQKMGIDLIAPHRKNRVKKPTQDGRKMRRYKRRWKVERLFAHLQYFRRLVTRYECYAENFHGFMLLGCALLLLRHL